MVWDFLFHSVKFFNLKKFFIEIYTFIKTHGCTVCRQHPCIWVKFCLHNFENIIPNSWLPLWDVPIFVTRLHVNLHHVLLKLVYRFQTTLYIF